MTELYGQQLKSTPHVKRNGPSKSPLIGMTLESALDCIVRGNGAFATVKNMSGKVLREAGDPDSEFRVVVVLDKGRVWRIVEEE